MARQLRFLRAALPICALALTPPAAQGQTASLVEDIATQEESFDFGQALLPLRAVGERLFFLSQDPNSGTEPWGTDGSVPGTRMLADTCPGGCGDSGEILGLLKDRLLWFDGRIWSTDGTPSGTTQLTAANFRVTTRYAPVSPAADSAFAGGQLYFHGCLQQNATNQECSLWRTDGTAAGTRPVPAPDGESYHASLLAGGGGRVFFLRWHPSPVGIWVADADGIRPVIDVAEEGTANLWAVWEGRLFFTQRDGNSRKLWVTDGTAGGTRSLASFTGDLHNWLTTGTRGIYFVGDDGVHGQEIWLSDGTPGGTRRITEFSSSQPFHLLEPARRPEGLAFEVGDRLLFAADDRITGPRVWSTTGTPQSTQAVGDPVLSSRLVRAKDRVFFFRYRQDGPSCEVWSVDGRGAGTRLGSGFDPRLCGPDSSSENLILQAAGSGEEQRTWFVLPDTSGLWGVWRSDGTRAGTVRLFSVAQPVTGLAVTTGGQVYVTSDRKLWTWDADEGLRQVVGEGVRNQSSNPADLTTAAGKLVFSACGNASREVWISQGSAADTSPLTAIGATPCTSLLDITPSGSSVFFLRAVHLNDRELWRTDAAGSAPVRLTEALPDLRIVAFQGGVWFYRPEGEVWKSDGTPAGTGPALALPGGPLHLFSHPYPFAHTEGGRLYLLASRSGEDPGIWSTDGTPGGTVRLTDASPSGFDFEVVRAGSTLFLAIEHGLWTTDGTQAGTVRLSDGAGKDLVHDAHRLTAHAGALYLYGSNGSFTEYGLWRTDGTPAGTRLVAPYDKDGFPLDGPRPVSLGGRLFFLATDHEHGTELWATDGTPAGTALVADVHPGPADSWITELVAAGGAVWFAAQEPVHGRELWRTDGTAAGTRLVQDIAPEGLSSNPGSITAAGGRLYFAADDGVTGRELWSLPLSGPGGCVPTDTTLCLSGGRFRVEARWRDFQGNLGAGRAVPLTGDTGTFWFFEPSNVEVLLKVLDGRGLNDHFWVFFGALSSVEYSLTVTDTQTGFSRRYANPSGQLASAGDTEGFGPRGAHAANPGLFMAPPSPAALISARTEPAAATGSCQPGPRRLCLNDGRFAVEASWKDFFGNVGHGTAVPFTADTGWFWFFDPSNVEVMLKVLDGTALNGRFWVFYGALSNVEYTLTVTDTRTGAVKVYRNPSGRFASVADTGAF